MVKLYTHTLMLSHTWSKSDDTKDCCFCLLTFSDVFPVDLDLSIL